MHVFNDLNMLVTSNIRTIQRPPGARPLDVNTSAMEVFTDFTQQNPLMLEQNTPVDSARELMNRTHIKFFLVIDQQESFRGVITLDDLESEKIIREMGKLHLKRHELTVERVMTPNSRLRAISFTEFQLGNVGDVLATMKRYGEQHVLVVDTQSLSLRGIVSAHNIARRMHAPVSINERAVSFSDICRAIAG